ncbi:MAG TPA: DUF1684 domain-containing protein [Candidatus Limnocylindrales bacterium]|nr:DUF1684 domain-containing protein [Candidatus Limnocylindrales bacterium]
MIPEPTADVRTVVATLALADWRRAVAALYAEVRKLAMTDVDAALALWRETREQLYREHPQSPVPPDARATFRSHHFEHDRALRFEVVVDDLAETSETSRPADATARSAGFGALGGLAIQLPVSAGGGMSFERFGSVTIPFPDGPRRLEIYWMQGYAGGLFLPFRDSTNGAETYGAGRYLLDSAKSADLGAGADPNSLVLDFNFAFQPSCAFDPKWACPLAPPSNRLDLPVRAGERIA